MTHDESSTTENRTTTRLVDAFDHRVDFDDMMKWQKKQLLEFLCTTGKHDDHTEEQREKSKAHSAGLLKKFNEENPNLKDPYKGLPPRIRRPRTR